MKNGNKKSRFYKITHATFSGIVKILFNIRVINPENEPDEGGCLICANHVSATDPIIICYAFKKNQAHFMAKKELFKIPFLRGLIKLLGAFPVDRSGADVGAIKKAIAMLNDKNSVGIFPQGHRHKKVDPRSTSVKNGAGLICHRAECDVVPVYILRKNNTFRLFKRTYVIIGDKIEKSAVASKNNEEITSFIFDKVCALGESALRDTSIKL